LNGKGRPIKTKQVETKQASQPKERTPNEAMIQLAIARLQHLAEDAERSAFTGTISVQICYESGRAVTIHRRYEGRDKV